MADFISEVGHIIGLLFRHSDWLVHQICSRLISSPHLTSPRLISPHLIQPYLPFPSITVVMSGQELTTLKLLDLLEIERRAFSDDYLPFTQKQLQAITKFSNLLALDRTTIRRNIPKTRAHIILSDIWVHSSEIFVLCALATNPTSLGSLKLQDYLQTLLGWWNGGASKEVDRGYKPSFKCLTSKEDGYFWSKYYMYREIFLSLINRTLLINLRHPVVLY